MTTKFRSLLGFRTLRPRRVHEQKIMICEKFRHSLQVRGGMTRAMITSHKSCPTPPTHCHYYPFILSENTQSLETDKINILQKGLLKKLIPSLYCLISVSTWVSHLESWLLVCDMQHSDTRPAPAQGTFCPHLRIDCARLNDVKLLILNVDINIVTFTFSIEPKIHRFIIIFLGSQYSSFLFSDYVM